ncbi:MAG: 4Fe-4S dicluster domain-containing protein [Nitrospiraceae bacterium]|nr:MAG: 4Fe-4S dicluster domain-containing protein [Nitrospiraceae bacterium]
MSINRREFLKLAGTSTLIGLTGISAVEEILKGNAEASVLPSPAALTAKRWAMVIDINKIGTKEEYEKITQACHSIHNVPDIGNKKDEVKWIWQEDYEHSFPGISDEFVPDHIKHKPFLLLCNHCAKPPCVRVCPTKATFKRPDGIVVMDYHRCIGCRFCMAACPYGARSFNWRDPRPFVKETNPEFPTRTKGVVEKCTFCSERLAKGLKPACVEASNGALIFGDLEDPNSEVRKVLSTKYTLRRKPEIGTGPSVYYVIGGNEHAG